MKHIDIVIEELNNKIFSLEKNIKDVKILYDELYKSFKQNVNFYKNLNVEISGKQTGKTYRLIKDIFINFGKFKIAVITADKNTLSSIKNRIAIYSNLNNFYRNKCIQHYILYLTNINDVNNLSSEYRIYFDEFDFIKNINSVIIRDNMYFCTTPRYLRNEFNSNDILTKLIQLKNNKIINYKNNNSFLSKTEQGIFWYEN